MPPTSTIYVPKKDNSLHFHKEIVVHSCSQTKGISSTIDPKPNSYPSKNQPLIFPLLFIKNKIKYMKFNSKRNLSCPRIIPKKSEKVNSYIPPEAFHKLIRGSIDFSIIIFPLGWHTYESAILLVISVIRSYQVVSRRGFTPVQIQRYLKECLLFTMKKVTS